MLIEYTHIPRTLGEIAERFKKMLDIFGIMITIHSERIEIIATSPGRRS